MRDALASLLGGDRLSADAIKDLPEVSGFAPAWLTHNGDPETGPVPGNVVTAHHAPGWFSDTRAWEVDNIAVDGETSMTYTVRDEDAGKPLAYVMNPGGFGYVTMSR